MNKPPIKDKFLENAIAWKGTRWKIIVVGIKKISSKEQASFVLSENIKRMTPLIKSIVEHINKNIEKGSGNPLLDINSIWLLKLVIFPGIAFTKIALRNNWPRKFNDKNFFRFIKKY